MAYFIVYNIYSPITYLIIIYYTLIYSPTINLLYTGLLLYYISIYNPIIGLYPILVNISSSPIQIKVCGPSV